MPTPSATPAPAADAKPLTIKDFAFSPASMTVPAGTTVQATNRDNATHDWTSSAGIWGSGDLESGRSYAYRFSVAGQFDYVCTIHPSMTGSVTVAP